MSRIGQWSDATQCGVLIFISGVLMSTQLVIVRFIDDDISVFQIILFRTLFGLLAISGLIVRDAGTYLRPNRPVLAILCGFLAFLASTFFYLAAKELPVADITAIHFVRPVFAALVAAVALREALQGSRILAIAAGVIGAAIIVRPGFVEVNIGVLFVLEVQLQYKVGINKPKTALKKRSSGYCRHMECPDNTAFSDYHIIFFLDDPTWSQVGWMALIGVLEIGNQRILARAYARGDAIVVVILHYSRLPIAALIGFVVLSEFPDIWVWIGGAIIAAASIYLTVQERNKEIK